MEKQKYVYNAKIVNVVDGDTIDAELDLGFTVWVKIRFRLNGVDTPEINSSDSVKREEAKRAKEFTRTTLLGKDVVIESHKTDKYGRWLGTVYIDGMNFNQMLIEGTYALSYDGGKRTV